MAAVLYSSALIITDTAAITFGVFLFKENLPFNYAMPGFSFDGFSLSWAINYVHQVTLMLSTIAFYLVYFLFTLILMDHSCFKVDCALIHVQTLGNALTRGDDLPSHPLQFLSIERNLRKVKDAVGEVLVWQEEASDFLKLILMTVLGFHCLVLCLAIFALVQNLGAFSMALIFTMVILTELFMFCWMGSRVARRMDDLTKALHGINWDAMTPRHRKDLLMILMMSQRIGSFNGVFRLAELATFQEVMSAMPNDLLI